IKSALVAEYGSRVLALPSASGFDLSAYLVPLIGFAVGAVALGVGVARWRRTGRRKPPPSATSGPSEDDTKRLDADLARYDL
ncbi:MAG: cytochrome c-type biogenesis protein CcmH, partial [Solirubrobacterales bacterium]